MTNEETQTIEMRGPPAAMPAWAAWCAAAAHLRRQAAVALQFALFPLCVVGLWWFVGTREILPANILPGPDVVFQTLIEQLAGGEIAEHMAISLRRVAQGAALGVTLGLLLGVALGASPAFDGWIGPSFRILVQVPSIALIPLLMMVLGIDDKLKLFIMAKACVIPLALVTADGIRNLPKAYVEVAAALRLSRRSFYLRVVLPGALPSIFTGMRQGIAHVWVALVAVEIMASADGIGYLMNWSRHLFQLDVVLVCIAVIGATGFLLDAGMRRLEAHCLRWREAG